MKNQRWLLGIIWNFRKSSRNGRILAEPEFEPWSEGWEVGKVRLCYVAPPPWPLNTLLCHQVFYLERNSILVLSIGVCGSQMQCNNSFSQATVYFELKTYLFWSIATEPNLFWPFSSALLNFRSWVLKQFKSNSRWRPFSEERTLAINPSVLKRNLHEKTWTGGWGVSAEICTKTKYSFILATADILDWVNMRYSAQAALF